MSPDRWKDKEDVVHIYSGILLSHKREWNWVISRDVDGSRFCCIEWSKTEWERKESKSEKEKQILQGILYEDTENGCVDLGGRVEAGDWDLYIYITMCKIDSQWKHVVYYTEFSLMLSGDLGGWDKGREIQEAGDLCIYIHIADLLCCAAETNTTLSSIYSPMT